MLKHVIVESPLDGRIDEIEALGVEIRAIMKQRGWVPYVAWRTVAGDVGEPTLFDFGILGHAVTPERPLVVFEAEFPDRAALESQLHAMRNDREVVRLMLRASELIDHTARQAYIVELWRPSVEGATHRGLIAGSR